MKILLIILTVVILSADIKQEMLHLYQNKNFEEVCNLGFKNFNANSKEARTNTTYFSTILLQKKLLYYAMIDEENSALKYKLYILIDKIVIEEFYNSKSIKKHIYW
jgi:hypothetical protein